MGTGFRAGVMLSVLVGLPAAWVYYGPLPPNAQRVVDRFVAVAKEAAGWDKPAAPVAARQVEDAPSFVVGDGTNPAIAPLGGARPGSAPLAPPPGRAATTPPAGGGALTALEPLLEKLQRLGAATYALERWGAAGSLYRFRCEMPLAAGGVMTQQFEAVAADPHASVAQVVAEVSSWQLARASGPLLH
jgi:hypothetical protein